MVSIHCKIHCFKSQMLTSWVIHFGHQAAWQENFHCWKIEWMRPFNCTLGRTIPDVEVYFFFLFCFLRHDNSLCVGQQWLTETMNNFIQWTGSETCPWACFVFCRNMLHGLQYTSAVKGYFYPPERIATLVGDVQLCLGVFKSTTQNWNCDVSTGDGTSSEVQNFSPNRY